MPMRTGILLLGILLLVGLGFIAVRELSLGAGAWCGDGAAGIELVLQADRAELGRKHAGMDKTMGEARDIIARRIDALGACKASVSRYGANRILVTVAGISDPASVRALIIPRGRVEFRLVDPTVTREQLASGQVSPGSEILYPEGGGAVPMAVGRRTVVTGTMIASARQVFDGTGSPVVAITFTDEGARRFARATTENVGRPFAIVVDDVVVSAPNINEPITGGMAQINGAFSVDSANQLAIRINSGALPIRLAVVEERVLGPKDP